MALASGEITGRELATGEGLRIGWQDGVVTAIEATRNADDLVLVPGLVDLQVNGYAGFDVNSPALDFDTLTGLAGAMRSVGVTTFLPTLITMSESRILSALEVIAHARAEDALLAHMMPYVHVEGPHISPQDGPRGAHPSDHVRVPDTAEFDRWQDTSGGLVGLVTVSPHFDQTPDYVRHLTKTGVRVAIGHTDAGREQICAAVDAGASLSTHLGNGVSHLLPRHPNLIWTQLAEDRLTACLIGDGHHLGEDVFVAMLRAKGLENTVLVSDTVAEGGLTPGFHRQASGAQVELSRHGRLSLRGTPYLAGAARPLKEGVMWAKGTARLDWPDAFALATRNPGRILGRRGVLAVGAPADLLALRIDGADRFEIVKTIAFGRTPD